MVSLGTSSKYVDVTVHFLDKSQKKFPCAEDGTFETLCIAVCESFSIPDAFNTARYFGIFEMEKNKFLGCFPQDDSPLSVITSWDVLGRTPKLVFTVNRVFERFLNKRRSTCSITAHFLYTQAIFDVSTSHYPLTIDDILNLAAVQFNVEFGKDMQDASKGSVRNRVDEVRKALGQRLDEFVPVDVLADEGNHDFQWETEILDLAMKMDISDPGELKLRYLVALERRGRWKWPESAACNTSNERTPRPAHYFEDGHIDRYGNRTLRFPSRSLSMLLKIYKRKDKIQAESGSDMPKMTFQNAMICAHVHAGEWEEALRLREEMKKLGIHPDVVAYRALLYACDIGGEWKMALVLLEELQSNYGLRDVISLSSAISACEKRGQWKQAETLRGFLTGAARDGISITSVKDDTISKDRSSDLFSILFCSSTVYGSTHQSCTPLPGLKPILKTDSAFTKFKWPSGRSKQKITFGMEDEVFEFHQKNPSSTRM